MNSMCINCRRSYNPTSVICPVQKQVIILTRFGRDKSRKIELERQCERKETEEEEKTRQEDKGNHGKGGKTQVAVAIEISKRREVSPRPVTRDGRNGDLRMRDLGRQQKYHDWKYHSMLPPTGRKTPSLAPLNVDITT